MRPDTKVQFIRPAPRIKTTALAVITILLIAAFIGTVVCLAVYVAKPHAAALKTALYHQG